ncbi:hypothetical protein AGOR_G00186930 [Albula goreensis]|uniref:Uncharacterized protein n=1 Tax=Albula goreensis TaxID=1534307 RepID=A0A8T3CXY9_9TELE|nr:hypothetical protein AGOR_G00186930 [Albula goreensis]
MSEAILTFQAQLSGIMETVLKTAVFEITWLVESSFQGEVVRSRQEVELLRQRLQVAEGRRSGGKGSASSTCVECGRAAASGRGKERRTSGAQTGVVETCIIKEEKEPERTQSSCLMDQSAEATPPSTRVSKPTYLEGDGFELMQKKEDHKGGVGNHCLKVTVESSAHSYGDEDLLSKGMGELCEDLGQDLDGPPPREPGLKGAPQAHTGWPSSPDSECITFERVTVPGGGDSDGEVCGQGLSHGVGRVAESEPRGDIADRHGIQIESVVSLSRPQHCAANHSRRKTLRRPREAALRHLGPAGRLGQASACQGAMEAQSGVSEMAGSTLCETSFTASSIRTLPDFDVGTGDKQINCIL